MTHPPEGKKAVFTKDVSLNQHDEMNLHDLKGPIYDVTDVKIYC